MWRRHGLDQIIHHFLAMLLAGLVDFLHLGLGLLVGVIFGFLVSARLLFDIISILDPLRSHNSARGVRTSASNFLNSSSFFRLYSSISFCASVLASFTLLVRSGSGQRGTQNRKEVVVVSYILWLHSDISMRPSVVGRATLPFWTIFCASFSACNPKRSVVYEAPESPSSTTYIQQCLDACGVLGRLYSLSAHSFEKKTRHKPSWRGPAGRLNRRNDRRRQNRKRQQVYLSYLVVVVQPLAQAVTQSVTSVPSLARSVPAFGC